MSGMAKAFKNPIKAVKNLIHNPSKAIVPKNIRNSSVYKNIARPVIKLGTAAAEGFLVGGPVGAVAAAGTVAATGGLTNNAFRPLSNIVLPAAAAATANFAQGALAGSGTADVLAGGTGAPSTIAGFTNPLANLGISSGITAGGGYAGGGGISGAIQALLPSGASNALSGVKRVAGSLFNQQGQPGNPVYDQQGNIVGYSGGGGGGGSPSNWLQTGLQLAGAAYGANRSNAAAAVQAASAERANQTTLAMFNQNRTDIAPWRATGTTALNQLGAETLGANAPLTHAFGVSDFRADPGYQFRLSEGQKAIDNKLASLGLSQSGVAVKEAARFNQGTADQAYQSAYGRFNQDQSNRFSRLSALSNTGVNAAGRIANLGANAANRVGVNQVGIGNAQAAGKVGAANSYINALNNYNNQNAQLQALYGRR